MATNTLDNPEPPHLSGLSWLLPNRGCEDSYIGFINPSQQPLIQEFGFFPS